MAEETPSPDHSHDGTMIDTIQSLIVAFVLAMTFRGFVTEGFVIPTGSMAPTLLGEHLLIHSDQTGVTFPVGLDQSNAGRLTANHVANRLTDPMLGETFPSSVTGPNYPRPRMGDRILVLKCLYPFVEPNRFDVVVFKNPTDPIGETSNYIKRLIGLPNERIWLVDGDVFAKHVNDDAYRIQRKPEHVQRAVWRTVHHSDSVPIDLNRLHDRFGPRYSGSPWVGNGAHWNTSGRSYICTTDQPTALIWDSTRRALNDWTPYNMLAGSPTLYPMSDLRLSAGIAAEQEGLSTMVELEARGHIFQFGVKEGEALIRLRPVDDPTGWVERRANVDLPPPGRVFNMECWHVDQAMHLFIDGERVMAPLEYDLSPLERLQFATDERRNDDIDELISLAAQPPKLRWHFSGSPVTLHRVQVDRDLHYRFDYLSGSRGSQKNEPRIDGPAFGTHPEENAAILGPDHFMMLGDNSQMSLDSRLWGSPHPLVASQIDPTPFVVNRQLLLGKAWVVYFPSPYSLTETGWRVIPDFGRLRFIR